MARMLPGAGPLFGASGDSAIRTLLGHRGQQDVGTTSLNELVLVPDQPIATAGAGDDPMARFRTALLLEHEISRIFGTTDFVARARRTAEMLATSLRLSERVLELAGMEQALAGARADDAAEDSSWSDALLFYVLRCQEAETSAAELRNELRRVEDERARATDQLDGALVQLTQKQEALSRVAERVVRVTKRKRELELENETLQARCHDLEGAVKGYREQLAVMGPVATGPGLTDDQLEHVYQFLWRHAHVQGTAEELYRTLHAAAADTADDLSPGAVVVNLMRLPGTVPTQEPPPAIRTLASFSPLSVPTSTEIDHDAGAPAPAPATRKRAGAKTSSVPPAKRGRNDERTPTRHAASAAGDVMLARRYQEAAFEEDDGDSDADEDDDVEIVDPPASSASKGRADSARVSEPWSSTGVAARGRASGGVPATRAAKQTTEKPARRGASPKRASANPTGTYLVHELAADQVRDCATVPAAVRDQPLTTLKFPERRVELVFGPVRGRSSTVKSATNMSTRHRTLVFGIGTQRISGQSTFFPNYTPARTDTSTLMARLGVNTGYDAYDALLEAEPWDEMWRQRVTRVYLFDPNQLSQEQVDWLLRVLQFMYANRRQFWIRCHWLSISRSADTSQEWHERYLSRQREDARFTEDFNRLLDTAPDGVTSLIWSEPAFWFAPRRQCPWIIRSVEEASLEEQDDEIDGLEPVRAQWTKAPERFVEGLLPEQLRLLDANRGRCWALPAPWSYSNYQPPDEDDEGDDDHEDDE